MATSDDQRKNTEPHLVNINEDLLLSGVVFHFIPRGTTTIGRKEAKPTPDIAFNGLRLGRKVIGSLGSGYEGTGIT